MGSSFRKGAKPLCLSRVIKKMKKKDFHTSPSVFKYIEFEYKKGSTRSPLEDFVKQIIDNMFLVIFLKSSSFSIFFLKVNICFVFRKNAEDLALTPCDHMHSIYDEKEKNKRRRRIETSRRKRIRELRSACLKGLRRDLSGIIRQNCFVIRMVIVYLK